MSSLEVHIISSSSSLTLTRRRLSSMLWHTNSNSTFLSVAVVLILLNFLSLIENINSFTFKLNSNNVRSSNSRYNPNLNKRQKVDNILSVVDDPIIRGVKTSFVSSSSTSSLSSSTTESNEKTDDDIIQNTKENEFTEEQLDFIKGYLNKHHSNILQKISIVFSKLGSIKKRKNAFSGGSYQIQTAHMIDLKKSDANDADGSSIMVLNATIQMRNQKELSYETVEISLDSDPIAEYEREYKPQQKIKHLPNDEIFSNEVYQFARKFNRLCNIINEPSITGKLIQLATQITSQAIPNSILKLHDDLYLNQVPHNRYVRKYFYDMASHATLQAVIDCSQHEVSNRMKVVCMFPELNPSMDSYRIGTLLELVRSMALRLCEENLRVRICVQQSLGVGIFTAVPKQLNGVATLLQRMDWLSGEGEENEGILGTLVNFGAIGKDHVQNRIYDEIDKAKVLQEQDDVFIIIAPQSMVGIDTSIIGPLQEMVNAAGDRPIILINPDLTDKVSSQGQQNVRGRQQRLDFANSFETIYQFQNIYVSGTSYFPILGAIGKFGSRYPYVAYQRRDWITGDKDSSSGSGEIYVPVLSSEYPPTGEDILDSFE